ncbi:hypothetical protein [Sphingomonas daechungensis]|nr:hypothetical protein [Sphingomonas daechungensis]
MAIFLSLFAASLLLFTLGVTTGTNFLLYAGLILFGVLVTDWHCGPLPTP